MFGQKKKKGKPLYLPVYNPGMHDPSEPQVCIFDDTNGSRPYSRSTYHRAASIEMQDAPFGRHHTIGGFTPSSPPYFNNRWNDRNDGRFHHRLFRARNRTRRRVMQRHVRGIPMVVLIILIVGLSVTTLTSIAGVIVLKGRMTETRTRDRLVYSPAKEAEKWTAVRFDGDVQSTNKFKVREGESDERWREVNKVWNELYDVEPFAVSGQQLQKMNQSSMEIPSRPGQHLVKLSVFHQLHCLDMVRKYIHSSHYKFDEHHATVPLIDHVDHCVDILRQAITCHADTALITFSFHPDRPELVDPNFNVMHECKDFEAIRKWEKEREVKMENEIKNNLDAFLKAFSSHDKAPDTAAAGMQTG